MVPQQCEKLLSSTKHRVPATMQGSGTALEDTGAQCCCQAAWDPGWKQVLGSATPQAMRSNPLLLLVVAQLQETSVFHTLL